MQMNATFVVLQRWRFGFSYVPSIYGVFASCFTKRLSQQPFRTPIKNPEKKDSNLPQILRRK